MRIAIVGSRDYPDMQAVVNFVNALEPGDVVITGGAHGVDTEAERAALARGLGVVVYPADWDRHGRAAGPIRNQMIVDSADTVMAFWDGRSPGTRDTIQRASAAGKLYAYQVSAPSAPSPSP